MRRIWIALATILLAAILLAAIHAPARADDPWRYCVAQDEGGHRVFITEAFPTSLDMELLERSFNAWLDKSGKPHRWGICPRSASAFDAAADVESAVKYNRRLGFVEQFVAWPDARS
jgi:hypothetical protein